MLTADERLQGALGVAYHYVSRRERTVNEVREHLQRRGVARETIERTIEALRDQGYVDDARFTRLFIEDKRALEEWGNERIRKGLLARGIDRELADAVLGNETRGEELSRAVEVLRRRFPSMSDDRSGLERAGMAEQARALAVLLRKGYDTELALDAVRLHLVAGGSP
jgi:regulatory protein